jgi:hypothetical protein
MILPVAFVVAGVFFVLGALERRRDTESADGVVIAIENHPGGNSSRPIVEYSVGQHRHQCLGTIYSGLVTYHVGESVRVLYKTDDPKVASIDSFVQNWAVPTTLFAAGFGFAALILFGRRNLQHLKHGTRRRRGT